MMLYRYLSAEFALQALQHSSWKIGRLLELNDPMDCQPRFHFGGKKDCDPVDIPVRYREIVSQVGILCFSASIDDPVLWSHYANVHRGIALGFDLDEGELRRIEYREDNQRAEVDLDWNANFSLSDEGDIAMALEDGYCRKALSWKYEDEWRSFIELSQCQMVGPHYFKKVPMDRLRRVVLGARCQFTPFDLSVILENNPYQPNARIYQASIDRISYRLKIEATNHQPRFGRVS